MSKQLFEKLLQDYSKSNKERKEKIAIKAGYSTGDEYKAYLQSQIGNTVTVELPVGLGKTSAAKVRPTIHIVDIIDCSGSMSGSKLDSAIEGINGGVSNLQMQKGLNVDYMYTLCNFSEPNYINISNTLPIRDVKKISFRARSSTALNDAVGKSIETILERRSSNQDKVLINIYTDGQENSSVRYNNSSLSELIERVKGEGVTVTFIGTERDTANVIKNLSIEQTNTLSYDGTAKGLSKSMSVNSLARTDYSQAVLKGEDVTRGYFKNLDSSLKSENEN